MFYLFVCGIIRSVGDDNLKKTAFFYIVLASVLWGTSGLFAHFLRPFGFSSVQMTLMRGIVSMIIMVGFVLIKDRKLLKAPKKEILLLIGSGVSLFGTATAYYASMEASSVSTAVILMYTAPVFVLIYSVIFLGEKLNAVKTISIFLMLVGCALVSGIVGGMEFSLWGIIFGMISGITYSAYNIFTKILTLHKVPAVTVTSYNFIIMTVLGLITAKPLNMLDCAAKEPMVTIPLMIGIGVCTCILPYFFYTLGLRDIPAGTASSLGIIEPLSATIFSVCFLDEALTLPLIIGMILICGAVAALAKQK